MTTWPPRAYAAEQAMWSIVSQQHDAPVHYVLALSKDEWNYDGCHRKLPSPDTLLQKMKFMGVEVIWDDGNTKSHKKLMPALERYPDNAILVVDDDVMQHDGWLQTFINDHREHPTDIIYGVSTSRVEIVKGSIVEGPRDIYVNPGRVTRNEKPANGASGTLYPAHTFTDARFFNRALYMNLTPTSDETWQWAWAVMTGKTYRCLSKHNMPIHSNADQRVALWHTNRVRYNTYHNDIARLFPEYKEMLEKLITNQS